MECLSPNIHVPDLSAGPTSRKKRFQVHAACTQCKKSHAACSMTRPCERCVRVGEAHLCVDLPRKRRGKHANLLQLVNPLPLEPSPAISSSSSDDGSTPIDEISDFLFDGIENHLLTDSTLRNVSRMEGSVLSTSMLLQNRPLFNSSGTITLPYGISTTNNSSPSHSSSSDSLSPVPSSPYSPNSSTSPNSYHHSSKYILDNNALYNISANINQTISQYTSDNLQRSLDNLQTINISPNDDYYTSAAQQYYDNDEALINAHITNLLGDHIKSSTSSQTLPTNTATSSTTTSTSCTTTSATSTSTCNTTTSTVKSIWTDPSFIQSLSSNIEKDDPSQSLSTAPDTSTELSPSFTSPNFTSPNFASPNFSSPNHDGGPKPDPVARLMGIDASDVVGSCKEGCGMYQCFCDKITPDKPQVVCAISSHGRESVVPSVTPKPDATSSLHSVVESLVREVQSLKKEMRRDTTGEGVPKIGRVGHSTSGPAVAVWDLVEQRLLECNETFATLFCVNPSQPVFLTDIAQCPAYFLRLCAANATSWHEKRRYSLKRPPPEGDINLVIAIDINGTCVVTTVWKAE